MAKTTVNNDNLYPVYLPIDKNNTEPYKGKINGQEFSVPRGVLVMLQRDQYEVVSNSLKQDGIVAIAANEGAKSVTEMDKYLK